MKKILKFIPFLALALAVTALPVLNTGCQHRLTLEAGGVYSDPNLATADLAIHDALQAMDGFIAWNTANASFLAKYPEIGALAVKVQANENLWIKNAYAARDAYATAAKAYRDAIAAGASGATPPDPKLAELNGALAVINEITAQIAQYKSAHP